MNKRMTAGIWTHEQKRADRGPSSGAGWLRRGQTRDSPRVASPGIAVGTALASRKIEKRHRTPESDEGCQILVSRFVSGERDNRLATADRLAKPFRIGLGYNAVLHRGDLQLWFPVALLLFLLAEACNDDSAYF